MMEIKLEIKKRNREFGILTWPYTLDFEIKTLFGLSEQIDVEFNGVRIKKRKVSYRYRRVVIGKTRIARAGSCDHFIISKESDVLKIRTI